ncbi:MAG TPA: hypothetical protein VD948_12190 [Rhodothermales bacterium]|nr:hypothetical protein [Rhodothermales bacterium]
MEPVNDSLLAGFLAGTLTPDQRTHVVRYLADNVEAREVLRLAHQALHASDQPVQAPSRPPVRHARPRVPALARYALLLALVFSGGALIRVVTNPGTDELRSRPGETAASALKPVLRGDALQWAPVEEAAAYELVLWDPQEARVLHRVKTTETRTDETFAAAFRALPVTRTVAVRVDAFDAENRLLASSDLTMIER